MLKIQRYCTPSLIFALIRFLILCAPCYFFTKLIIQWFHEGEDTNFLIGSCALDLFLFVIPFFVHETFYGQYLRIFRKRWKYFRKANLTKIIKQDYANGNEYFNGTLIVGDHCMFGKKLGLIVFYNEITKIGRVHCYTDYASGSHTEDEDYLRVFAGDKKYDLCRLDSFFRSFSKSEKDWGRFCSYIKQNAPHILIERSAAVSSKYIDDTKKDDDD